MIIVPVAVSVEVILDIPLREPCQNELPPHFEGAKGAFDLAVEIGRSHAAFDVVDAHADDCSVEKVAELCAVVGPKNWIPITRGQFPRFLTYLMK